MQEGTRGDQGVPQGPPDPIGSRKGEDVRKALLHVEKALLSSAPHYRLDISTFESDLKERGPFQEDCKMGRGIGET